MSLEGIELQGNLLTRDFLDRLKSGDVPGARAPDYDVPGRLEDRITSAWNELRPVWHTFQEKHRSRDSPDGLEQAGAITRDHWVKYVFDTLRYGHLTPQAPLTIEGKTYPVLYRYQSVPIHLTPFTQDLDKGPDGTARGNPHSMLQEYLNRAPEVTWGILTNGLRWRILRDNAASTRPAYIEFDIEALMERFDEFSLWWRIAHASRITGDPCWLEKWMQEADREGVRALLALRRSVEEAIEALGIGFLKHPKNQALRQVIEKNELTAQQYFHEILRLVYRLLFLFVTEDRNLLLDPEVTPEVRETYAQYYSTQRLRRLAREMRGSQHHDLFESLKVVIKALKSAAGCKPLALPSLNSALWSNEFIPHLDAASIRNVDLLRAIRYLSRISTNKGVQTVNHGKLGPEELGSVYESLLEFSATVTPADRLFKLIAVSGSERRITATHYTPTEFIDPILNYALDPILDDAVKEEDPEKALLELTLCDPTCGSGHFLVAAAHRIARRLAAIRTGEEEPALGDLRRALRDVIGRCIYGVDINPMTVELCKIGLWLEAMEPGKPLAYLDHHIKCGNALMGASPEYLEAGIPGEAYSSRHNVDDKEVCQELLAVNRRAPMDATTLDNFRRNRSQLRLVLAETLGRIEAMPTTTVDEVEAKAREYETSFTRTNEYSRYKQAHDAWCAAFTYPKTELGSKRNITNTQLVDILHTDAEVDPEVAELVKQEVSVNRFFHWELEFPQVFAKGGFRLVVGNPPYMGGGKVNTRLGGHYNSFLEATFPPYSTLGDLATAFLRKFWRLARADGRIGAITTNSISKGATRTSGLQPLVRNGVQIAAAFTDMEWPGDAAVVVSMIVLCGDSSVRILNGQNVSYISSRLDSLPEHDPLPVSGRRGVAFIGHQPAGAGFLVEQGEYESWRLSDPKVDEVVLDYLISDDLLQDVGHKPRRKVVCFGEMELEQARRYRNPIEHVFNKVKPSRESNPRKVYRDKWWRFAEYRKELAGKMVNCDHVLVRSRVSETPLFVRVPAAYCISDSLIVVVDATWSMVGQLNSMVHEVWYRRQGARMKQDLRYTPSTCFENFPIPRESPVVASIGEAFHEMVLSVSKQRGIALTPVWNRVNDPLCRDIDIGEVRRLRSELTLAVASAFDIEQVDYRFGFYKDHAERWRFAMCQEAVEQVYAQLVELNAKQAPRMTRELGKAQTTMAPFG